jgi:phage terminase small subunit
MPALQNEQHELFCHEYVAARFNGRKAAIAAGYDSDNPSQTAWQLKRREDIRDRIAELSERPLRLADVTAERIVQEAARIAFGDIRAVFDDEGNLKPIHQLSDDAAACIEAMEIDTKSETEIDEDGNKKYTTIRTAKIKRAPKLAALRLLMEYHKMIGPTQTDIQNVFAGMAALFDQKRAARRQFEQAQLVERIN